MEEGNQKGDRLVSLIFCSFVMHDYLSCGKYFSGEKNAVKRRSLYAADTEGISGDGGKGV